MTGAPIAAPTEDEAILSFARALDFEESTRHVLRERDRQRQNGLQADVRWSAERGLLRLVSTVVQKDGRTTALSVDMSL